MNADFGRNCRIRPVQSFAGRYTSAAVLGGTPPPPWPAQFPSVDSYYVKEPVFVLQFSRVVLRRAEGPNGAAVDRPGLGFLRVGQVDPGEEEMVGLRGCSQIELQLAAVSGIHQVLLSGDRGG